MRERFVVEPPFPLPPGYVVHLPGRGEMFVRDSGGDGPPVLLLHGWIFQSDLNWYRTYEPLIAAGYRVLAIDHRGHGRGLRAEQPFRLSECAADAAAVVDRLGCGPVTAIGYSMGGAIAQLMGRDHAAQVSGLVLCATSRDWQGRQLKAVFAAMGLVRVTLNLFPYAFWRRTLQREGFPDNATTAWVAAELSRGSGRAQGQPELLHIGRATMPECRASAPSTPSSSRCTGETILLRFSSVPCRSGESRDRVDRSARGLASSASGPAR